MSTECPDKAKSVIEFTLIELMVVVAILSVLACLLLPALRLARETVKSLDCKNRLKQYGTISLMYAAESNGWLQTYDSNSRWWQAIPGMPEKGNWTERAQQISCPCAPKSTDSYHTYGVCLDTTQTKTNGVWFTRTTAVDNPSCYDFLADTAGETGAQSDYYYRKQSGNWSRICMRHNKQGNMFFLDGHVTSLFLGQQTPTGVKYVRLPDGTEVVQ